MLHSRLFVESQEYREKMFEKHIYDRPLVVQVSPIDETDHTRYWLQQLIWDGSSTLLLVLRQRSCDCAGCCQACGGPLRRCGSESGLSAGERSLEVIDSIGFVT